MSHQSGTCFKPKTYSTRSLRLETPSTQTLLGPRSRSRARVLIARERSVARKLRMRARNQRANERTLSLLLDRGQICGLQCGLRRALVVDVDKLAH